MAVPNLKDVVKRVRDSQPWTFQTKPQLCAYSQAVIAALHRTDPRFGHLAKGPNNNHCTDPLDRRVAVDVALFRPTGQIIDVIVSAGFGDPFLDDKGNVVPLDQQNRVAWQVGPEGEYTEADWILPVDVVTVPPDWPPPDTPPGELPSDIQGILELIQVTGERLIALERRVEAINKNLRAVDAASVKTPLPTYRGEGSFFGIRIPVTITKEP